jgi:sugar/nucleoside kinase (ribokinase family)
MSHRDAQDVLVIGNNTVDIVFAAGAALAADGKLQAETLSLYGGGQGANVAATLGLLGVPTRYFGAFGGGDFAELSKRSLLEAGVRVDARLTVSSCAQHAAAIVVDTSHRTRAVVMHKDERLKLDGVPAEMAPLEGCRFVYTDGCEEAFSIALAKRALAQGIPVMADAETASDGALALLPFLDILVAPGKVLLALAGKRALKDAARLLLSWGPREVVATLGSDGCEGFTASGRHCRLPAERCAVVDTTGAGDAFHAGYLAAVLSGFDFEASLRFATQVAALKCGAPGPRATPERLSPLRMSLGGRTLQAGGGAVEGRAP